MKTDDFSQDDPQAKKHTCNTVAGKTDSGNYEDFCRQCKEQHKWEELADWLRDNVYDN